MGSSADENRKRPWDAVIRELVAKGEVSQDVLYDSDTIIRWWRSLNPTKQEEIKSRVEELSQGVFAEVPEKKTKTKTRRPLLLVLAFVIVLSISLVVYAQISTPTPELSLEPTSIPESSEASPIQTAAGDLVIEVNENALSINNNRFDMDSTLDDYIKVLGNPSRVTELMNTIHTYDDDGIRLYHPPDSDRVISVGIDFRNYGYQFSPKHTFQGVLTIGHLSVDSSLHLDSLRSIPGLTLEDLEFGVYRGTLGSIILMFDYQQSKQRLDSLAISFSESSREPTTPAELTPIEDGWVRLIIADVGSIDYPADFLELQSGEYGEMNESLFQVYELPSPSFILQQTGLNELKPLAFDEYRRVVFKTDYLNPGEEVFRANEKYTMSQEELIEFRDELIDQLQREYARLQITGFENKIIDPGSLEIMEVNGMFPMVHTYKRQLNDNPVVLVKAYMFFDYDRIHTLVFSYRVADDEECRDIYDKMLDSFRLQ